MTFIITQNCIGTCDTACVDCIHFTQDDCGETAQQSDFDSEGKQLYINPEDCIDCGSCEPECPVNAIFEESEVPEDMQKFIKINYNHFNQEP